MYSVLISAVYCGWTLDKSALDLLSSIGQHACPLVINGTLELRLLQGES